MAEQSVKEFYNEVSDEKIPEDILLKVLGRMSNSLKVLRIGENLAFTMHNDELLTYEQYRDFSNPYLEGGQSVTSRLFSALVDKGPQKTVLVKFYHSLLNSSINPQIAAELRGHALLLCGVDRVVVDGCTTPRTVERMADQLQGKRVSEQLAKALAKAFDLSGDELGTPPETDLADITKKWITKNPNSSTPQSLIEALVCTEGLGMFASGIGCPTNPPRVGWFFRSLHNSWKRMAQYLGYTSDDIESIIAQPGVTSVDREITKFLEMFRMPDCGVSTDVILSRAAHSAGLRLKSDLSAEPRAGIAPRLDSAEPPHGFSSQQTQASSSVPGTASLFPPKASPHYSLGTASLFPPPPPFEVLAQMFQTLATAYSPHGPHWNAHQRQWSTGAQLDMSRAGTDHYRSGDRVEDCDPHQHKGDNSSLETVQKRRVSDASSDGDHEASYPLHPAHHEYKEYRRDAMDPLIVNCGKSTNEAYETVDTLLRSCPNPEEVLKVVSPADGSHPLHLGVQSKSERMLHLLAATYSSLKLTDVVRYDRKTALMMACIGKNFKFVNVLIGAGANPDQKDCDGRTCLHYKETLECPDIVKYLLDNGASVDNPSNDTSVTPLTMACYIGQCETVRILLEKGASPNWAVNDGQYTPLSIAAGSGHVDIVKMLLRCGAAVDPEDGAQTAAPPLCVVAHAGSMEIVQILLDHEANVDVKDKDGRTPLIIACGAGHVNVVSQLLDNKASIDVTDKDGNTPVLIAVTNSDANLLDTVLSRGADVNRHKLNHETMEFSDIVLLTRKVVKGGALSLEREYEVAPLSLAAAMGKIELIEILMKHKADPNFTTDRTVSPLGWAVGCQHPEVVEYLLKLNEVDKTIFSLSSPLLIAIQAKENEIIDMLLDALGGLEKALLQATDASLKEVSEALIDIDDKRKSVTIAKDEECTETNGRRLVDVDFGSLAHNNLLEFMQCAITTAVNNTSRESIIQTARSKGYEKVANFFEKFFITVDHDCDVVEFINQTLNPSPAFFLFESEDFFDGASLKVVMEERGCIDIIEKLPQIIMQLFQHEALESLSDDELMKWFLGARFVKEFRSLNISLQKSQGTASCRGGNEARPVLSMPSQKAIVRRPSKDGNKSRSASFTANQKAIELSSNDERVENAVKHEDASASKTYGTTVQENLTRTAKVASKLRQPGWGYSCIDKRKRDSGDTRKPLLCESTTGGSSSAHFHTNNKSRKNRSATEEKVSTNRKKTHSLTSSISEASLHTQDGSYVADLLIPCSPIKEDIAHDLFKCLSRRVTQWQWLGEKLKVDTVDIKAIDCQYAFVVEKCYQMLRKWYSKHSATRTYRVLAEALRDIEHKHLVTDIYKFAVEDRVVAVVHVSQRNTLKSITQLLQILDEKMSHEPDSQFLVTVIKETT